MRKILIILVVLLATGVAGFLFLHQNKKEVAIVITDVPSVPVEPVSTSTIATTATVTIPVIKTPAPVKKQIDMKVVTPDPSSYEGRLIVLTNKERTTPLKESKILDERALGRAQFVCTVAFNEATHYSFRQVAGFSTLTDLAHATGENLARNFKGDVDATHAAFMASPTHKANIVKDSYQYIGVAHVLCPPNDFGTEEVTVEFFTGEALSI